MPALDLLSKERVLVLVDTSLLQLAAVEQLRAMNEVWNLGPQTPSGG